MGKLGEMKRKIFFDRLGVRVSVKNNEVDSSGFIGHSKSYIKQKHAVKEKEESRESGKKERKRRQEGRTEKNCFLYNILTIVLPLRIKLILRALEPFWGKLF